MNFRTLKYHITQGISGVFKNRLMSLAAIITVMACIFILIISLCLIENIGYVFNQLENKIGISVFIEDSVDESEISFIQKSLGEINHVTEVKYVSKEDALNESKDRWGSSITEDLEKDNPLPRSFDVILDESENQEFVFNQIVNFQKNYEETIIGKVVEKEFSEKINKKESDSNTEDETTAEENISQDTKDKDGITLEEYKNAELSRIGQEDYEYRGIYKVSASQSAAESFSTIKNAIKVGSFTLIIIMAIVATGIIVNTIKLTVFVRRNEINIMKYVGATDRFIRGPFIVEGLFIGLVGAIIPCIISWLAYDSFISVIYNEFSILKRLFEFCPSSEVFSLIVPISIILGGGLGALGSIASVRKHLNV